MAEGARGQVDFGDEGFVAQFDYSPEIVARMKSIQRRRFLRDRKVWIVERHWPSVHRLFQIALDYAFRITPKARAEEVQLREESREVEYSVDAVHDHCGAMWFLCKTGEDDELRRKVRDLEGTFWDDAWWVPTDWERSCGPLREIVDADERFIVSNAARRLLYEEDVSDDYVRSQLSPRAVRVAPSVSLHAVESDRIESVGTVRKPRVTAQGAQFQSEPEKEKEKDSA